MSDDIVTRLREYEAITDNAYVINALVAAADEIERLRAELAELIRLGNLGAIVPAKAVRGES